MSEENKILQIGEFDEQTIRDFYNFLKHPKGTYTEIRIFDPSKGKLIGQEWINTEEDFVKSCKRLDGRGNIFAGINPRREKKGDAKSVSHLTCIPFDIDSKREDIKEAATDKEIMKCARVVKEVRKYLEEIAGVRIGTTMSGNGFHLIPCIPPIEINDKNRSNIQLKNKIFQEEIKKRFESDDAKIDIIADLPRIIKVPGTKSVKGSNTIERPHRYAKKLQLKRNESKKFAEYLKNIKIPDTTIENISFKSTKKGLIKIDGIELDDLSLKGVVEKLGNIQLVPAGKDLVGTCPFKDHNDTTPSFRIYSSGTRNEHYHCFGCGKHGKNTVNFVMEFLDIGETNARVLLGMISNDVIRIIGKTNSVIKKTPKTDGKEFEWCITVDNKKIHALTSELTSLKWMKIWWMENTNDILRLGGGDFNDLLYLWQQKAVIEYLQTEDRVDYVAERILNTIRQAERVENIKDIGKNERRCFIDKDDTLFYCGKFINEIASTEKVGLRKIRFLLNSYIKDNPINKMIDGRVEKVWKFFAKKIDGEKENNDE